MMAGVPKMAKTYNNLFIHRVINNEVGTHEAAIKYPVVTHDWAMGTVEGGIQGILNVCKKPMISFEELDQEKFMEDGDEMLETTFKLTY